MFTPGAEPFYFLRRIDGRGYVVTDDGENFDVVPHRHLATAFCADHAPMVARLLHDLTGVRHRLVLAGYGNPATSPSPYTALLELTVEGHA